MGGGLKGGLLNCWKSRYQSRAVQLEQEVTYDSPDPEPPRGPVMVSGRLVYSGGAYPFPAERPLLQRSASSRGASPSPADQRRTGRAFAMPAVPRAAAGAYPLPPVFLADMQPRRLVVRETFVVEAPVLPFARELRFG